MTADIAETSDKAGEGCAIDGADAEAGVGFDGVMEDGFDQKCGGFHGMWEVAAQFPGHYPVHCFPAGICIGAVELGADLKEVRLRPPGCDCVFSHHSEKFVTLTKDSLISHVLPTSQMKISGDRYM